MKFDMSRAWSEAMALLRVNRQVVLVVAGVFFFLPYLAMLLLLPDFAASMGPAEARQPADFEAMMEQLNLVFAEIWWALLLAALIQGIGTLGLIALLTDRNRPTVGEALLIGAKCLLPYLGAQIIQTLAIFLIVLVPVAIGAAAGAAAGLLVGLMALVAVLYLFTKFSLTMPVIVAERVYNPIRALGRSWTLTKGNSVRLFLFYVLLFIALLVISMVIGILAGVLALVAGEGGSPIISGAINALLNMIIIVVFLAVLAAVHRQFAGAGAPTEAFE